MTEPTAPQPTAPQPTTPPALPPIGSLADHRTPHHGSLAAQHAQTLAASPLVLHAAGIAVATAWTGPFARLVFVYGPPDAAVPLDDPGMAIEHFVFNATSTPHVRLLAPTLGTRGLRVFDEHGTLLRDDLVGFSSSAVTLAIPPGGYARF